MKTLGERMMISFPQVMSSFVVRPGKIRDPNARDHIGVGAFILSVAALTMPSALREAAIEVVDDLKLGEAIRKRACDRT